jgi:hypothetical protein
MRFNRREPPNVFGVADTKLHAINAWVQTELDHPEKRSDPIPTAFSDTFRDAAQAAFARLFAHNTYMVVAGVAALALLPVLTLISAFS